MTGRRLYEIVCDELYRQRAEERGYYDRDITRSSSCIAYEDAPPAFAFLPTREQDAWNAAAKRVKGRS